MAPLTLSFGNGDRTGMHLGRTSQSDSSESLSSSADMPTGASESAPTDLSGPPMPGALLDGLRAAGLSTAP